MRTFTLAVALLLAGTAPAAAQIASPERPVTDPRTVTSPANPAAAPVPVEDLAYSRTLGSTAWSADGKDIFLVTSLTGRNNIWRMPASGGWPVQLTRADDSHSGLTVSPDGKLLYFLQDQGGNEQYDLYAVPTAGGPARNLSNTPELRETAPLIGPDGRTAVMSTKLKSEGQVNLSLFDLAAGTSTVLVKEANPQLRWSPVAWIDGGKAIIAVRDNSDSTVSEVWRVDVPSGKSTRILAKAKTIFDATDATPDGRMIAVTTNDGTGQLRAGLYDVATAKWRWLKPTPWAQSSGAFSPDNRTLTVRTIEDGRSTVTLVDVATLAERKLPLPPGLNALSGGVTPFSPDGQRMLLTHSGADTAADLHVVDTASGEARPVTSMALASLTPANLPKSTVVTFKSFDGTLISGIVTLPFNLKRDGSNPGIVFPHGGPTSQSQDGFNRIATALASRGYVVIQPNVRGSTGYGQKFQTANYQDLGGGDLKDVIAAKRFLVDTGYVDAKRVGITGGSYGGFMTLMAVAKAPDEFAAGVQLFGIINWFSMYETADPLLKEYIVSLLGDPVKDKAVYQATSPLTYVQNIKVPLLSLQGENDIRVPRGQAQEVADLLKAKGNIVETIFYPAEGHGFAKRENQIDSLTRTIDWFDRYLKGATPAAAGAQ